MPPVGNEEASGSPWMSSLPENSASAVPSPCGSKNESCFSAVSPVSGWNQCVKCVAPFSSAQSFIAAATASARSASSPSPVSIARWSFLKTSFGRRERCAASEKTLAPKTVAPGWVRSMAPRAPPLTLHWAALTFGCRVRGGMSRAVLLLRNGRLATLARFRATGVVRVDKRASPSGEERASDGKRPQAEVSTRGQRPNRSPRRSSWTTPIPRRSSSHVKNGAGARSARGGAGRAGPTGHGTGRHLERERPAAVRRHQLHVGDRRGLPGDVHAGGLRLPGDRLLARQERRHRGREDPHELLDRRDHVLGCWLRVRLRGGEVHRA